MSEFRCKPSNTNLQVFVTGKTQPAEGCLQEYCFRKSASGKIIKISNTYLPSLVRIGLIGLAVSCFVLSHTPFCLPTYMFSITAMAGLWRGRLAPNSAMQVIAETFLVGFSMGWLSTRFFANVALVYGYGDALHMLCSIIFSFQTVTIGIAIWWTRSWSIVRSSLVVASVSLLCELINAYTLGLIWVGTNAALAVAHTPLAQWSGLLTPFGLSMVLTFSALLWLPNWSDSSFTRWTPTLLAFGLSVGMWIGGVLIESFVPTPPLAMTVMLVQANSDDGCTSPHDQHMLTLESLQMDGGVDLILWGEGRVFGYRSDINSQPNIELKSKYNPSSPLSIEQFQNDLLPQYQCSCLIGAILYETVIVSNEAENNRNELQYNCGCLIAPGKPIQCHDKIALVPMSETPLPLSQWLPPLRNWLAPNSSQHAHYQPGTSFNPIDVSLRDGTIRKIGVSICYESWIPWLPQYHCNSSLVAICHLISDSTFKEHPECTERMLLTIRLRAIETRTWQLVCTHHQGTAIVDPRGRIVKQLHRGPGTLRTDQL